MSNETHIVEEKKQVQGKVVLSFNKPTPQWATWTFRIVFNLTLAIGIWVAGTNIIPEGHKVEALLVLKVLDYLIWGIARGLGVEKSDFDENSR